MDFHAWNSVSRETYQIYHQKKTLIEEKRILEDTIPWLVRQKLTIVNKAVGIPIDIFKLKNPHYTQRF